MNNDTFIYQIDRTDTLVSVSDNWCSFADANAWDGSLRPGCVVGHRLWDFIQDMETKHLYQELFKRVRGGLSSRSIPFRCDSPGERRQFELLIEAQPDNHIQITSRILETESRPPVLLLDRTVSRSKKLVTVCSMCKKMKTSQEKWEEIEEGLVHLKLFEADRMPLLTHGLCPACYHVAMGELEAMG